MEPTRTGKENRHGRRALDAMDRGRPQRKLRAAANKISKLEAEARSRRVRRQQDAAHARAVARKKKQSKKK